MPWARRSTRTIPALSSKSYNLEIDDYSEGFNSFTANDKFPVKDDGSNMWRLAQDARIPTLGEYDTRKGFDFHSDAAGVTEDDTQESTTGAADADFNAVTRLAQVFTTSSAGVLSKVDINIKNDQSATGVVIVEVWSDSSGEPGTKLAKSSITPSEITSSYQYLTARFANPAILATTTDYWIVVYVQDNASNSYSWSSTTSGASSLSSSDSGSSWDSTSVDLNFKQYYATSGGTKGLHRAYKSDGTSVTLFAQGTSLYSVNNSTGVLTAIKTGLNASATHYRFITVNDIVYYVNEYDGLRKWDFTTESQVSSTNYTHITEHKGLLMLVDATDPNKVVYSNFADYETFTSTDFIYVPSPKTGDPVTALISLNGYLIIPTRKNKYILSGSDNATFALDEAPDQKGTFTQETVVQDKNFIYYLSDDGVYRSNGSDAQLLSKNVYQDILTLDNKEGACMAVSKGRLYLWYSRPGISYNDRCYVWNLNYGDDTVESLDTDAFVCRAFNAFNDNELLVSSCLLGQVYWQELESNDYTNLGGDINFELRTHYYIYNSASYLKEIRYWNPRFGGQSGSYTIDCEFAYDLRDNFQLRQAIQTQGSGTIFGDGSEYGDGSLYGSSAELQAYLYVPGEYRRIAVRYKHHATRQPHRFYGHTFIAQTRRMR